MSLVPEEDEMCNKVHRVDSAPSWEPYTKGLAAETIFSFSHWWQRAADKHLNIQQTELAQHISGVLFQHSECPFRMPGAPTCSAVFFFANGRWVTVCRISQSSRASHTSFARPLHSDFRAELFSFPVYSSCLAVWITFSLSPCCAMRWFSHLFSSVKLWCLEGLLQVLTKADF